SLRGASAAGVRGAPIGGAQPPLVMSLQPPVATTYFRRGGLRSHNSQDLLNRPPTVPIATSSTRTYYRGSGLRSRTPVQDRPFFGAPPAYPEITNHHSDRRSSNVLPPTIISYRGNSRQHNYPRQESQIQENYKTEQPVIGEDGNVIGLKRTSPGGKTTIEFMQPPVFDSSGNPIILDIAASEDNMRPFDDASNETDYAYGSSSEGGIWDEEEEEGGIWGAEDNGGWSENHGGWRGGDRGGWGMGNVNNDWSIGSGRTQGQVAPNGVGSTHRDDTFGHSIEEDLSHLRRGYSPRRNYQHRNYNTPQVYPHSGEVLHRQVISPRIQTQEYMNNRKTLSVTEVMQATNNTSDQLVEILKQKGIVFKDFLQLLKDGATLQHVAALLSTPDNSNSTLRQDIARENFTVVLPTTIGVVFTNSNETSSDDFGDQHSEYDTSETEDLEGSESEEIFIIEHSEDKSYGRKKDINAGNSEKRHNRHGKSRRNKSKNNKKRNKKKSKDPASQSFHDTLNSTDIHSFNSSTEDNQEYDLSEPFIPQTTVSSTTTTKAILMLPTLATTASSPVIETSTGLPESLSDLKESTTIPPEMHPAGPRADALTLPPTNRISEATIISLSVEETLRIMPPNEETLSEFEYVQNTEVRKPVKGVYKQKEEDFKWDKTHIEEDYVQDIYTKPLDFDWQLTQVEKEVKDYRPLGHRQDEEHVVTSQDVLGEPIYEYKIPLKGLLVISGILGALAVFTFVILIAYTIVKCTKPPVVNNYQVNEQKS
ncbi:unnamed protein product, partial [Meganyctiphanes norvegica]